MTSRLAGRGATAGSASTEVRVRAETMVTRENRILSELGSFVVVDDSVYDGEMLGV
jgi:hypothetical protein